MPSVNKNEGISFNSLQWVSTQFVNYIRPSSSIYCHTIYATRHDPMSKYDLASALLKEFRTNGRMHSFHAMFLIQNLRWTNSLTPRSLIFSEPRNGGKGWHMTTWLHANAHLHLQSNLTVFRGVTRRSSRTTVKDHVITCPIPETAGLSAI